MTAQVGDLTGAGRFTFFMSDPSFEAVFGLQVEVRRRGDGTVVGHFREWGDGWSAARSCPDATLRWARARDLVRVGFPQGCFHAPLPHRWSLAVTSQLHITVTHRSEVDNPRKDLVLDRG
jgi:hypothetical protein